MTKRPAKLVALALLIAATAALASPGGPDDRYTGAPGDLGDCSSCHSDFPVNSGPGSINISENTTLFTTSYLPGANYTIIVKVAQTGMRRWGFELTALRDDTKAGAGNLVIIDPANTQKSVTGNRQYVKQTLAGTRAGTPDGPVSWYVNWTAPAKGTGNVTFYAAANAANNDDAETGDYIYTTSRRALAETPPPTAVFASPADGARVEGDVTVRVQASAPAGLRDIVLKLDGSQVASSASSPLEWAWDTRGSANGSHSLTATATDVAGNSNSTSVSVRVDNDLATPTVDVVSPSPGAKLNGTVAVVATASDDRGPPKVTFRLDGVVTQANSTSPYVWMWNTSQSRNGDHTLNVSASDAAGHLAGNEFTVTVENRLNDSKPPAVAIVTPPGGKVEGVVLVEAQASDESGVAEASFWHDGTLEQKNLSSGPRFAWVWDTRQNPNHDHMIEFKAYDLAGNEGVAEVICIGDNDRTPPVASFVEPEEGAVVAGIVEVVAEVQDDRVLEKVIFSLDGKERQADEPGQEHYEWLWNTSADPEGKHEVSVRGRDVAGNERTVTRNLTVDRTPPNVRFAAPGFAESVSGVFEVKVAAVDKVKVARVELLLGSQEVGSADAATLNWSWNTSSFDDGIYKFVARAIDAAGNLAETEREVAVLNTSPEGPPERGQEQFLPVAAIGAGWAGLILLWAFKRRPRPAKKKEVKR